MRRSLLIKLGAFVAVALVLGSMEYTTLTGPHVGTTHGYHAIFGGADGVSGLRTGDTVKSSGVAVGKVTGERLVDAQHVDVTFTANERQTLTTNTWAMVRYANLLGQRFLALTQSGPGGQPLRYGATIPQSQTQPALSLTALFNGFRPLFNGLSPQQVNELSSEIIAVLQGQGQGLEDLIKTTADLTGNLAQRDATFNQILDSLTSLLTTVSHHDDEVAAVLDSVHALTAALHAEGPGILDSLSSVNSLIGSVGGVLGKLEVHNLPGDVADLNAITGTVAANSGTLDTLVGGFVQAFGDFARVSQNGNWVNIYPCIVNAATYGTAQVTGRDGLAALESALGPQLGGLLSSLGLGSQQLAALALPLPVKVPVGPVGSSTEHTAVCR